MTTLEAGSPAPAFTLPDADGTSVSLEDFAGRNVVLYFYPAAMTPGCTVQAVDFTASVDAYSAAGYHIVGISPDTPKRLAAFRDNDDLSITLLADPDREVLEAYGAYGEKMLYGKAIEGVIRSTFVIAVNEEGSGTIELARYNVKSTGHVARLARQLGITN